MKQLLLVIAMSIPLHAAAKWEPPLNPDPETILDEAQMDTRAGRFEEALAKHLWFHHHALEHEQSLYGVRLSIAIKDWLDLGKVYPPAMQKLKETRDNAVKQVVEDTDNVRGHFADLRAINRQLGEEDLTVATFVLLDKEAPEAAKKVYDIAQPALVNAKEFDLCGKYLEPMKAYARMVELHRWNLEFAEGEESLERKQLELEIAEKAFMDRVMTLIALLVLNERRPEAEQIAAKGRGVSKHPTRIAIIDAALKGKLPKQLSE